MMRRPLRIVFIGLSLSSSWGNGHATTYRALMRGLASLGHELHFLERDVPWYAANRDLAQPEFCKLHIYRDGEELRAQLAGLGVADALVVGSYVPEGEAVIDLAMDANAGALCFYDIDTPVTLAKLDAADEEYIARRQVPAFDVYFSFSGGSVLERLERRYGARRALPLFCSVDAARYAPTGEAPRWDLGYLGTYSADRQPPLARLLIDTARRLPHRSFVVAGPQYPHDIEWPGNVERIDHLPPAEHASFYSRQRYTLNVTRADMIAAGHSPSVRLFEAAACGTPIVSDRWTGLTELFAEGKAIVIADTTDDIARALEETPEEARAAMAARARHTVLARHTGEARARELVAAVEAIHARSGSGRREA